MKWTLSSQSCCLPWYLSQQHYVSLSNLVPLSKLEYQLFLALVTTQQQAPQFHPYPKPPLLPAPPPKLTLPPTPPQRMKLRLPKLSIKLVCVCVCLYLSCFPWSGRKRGLYLFDIVKVAISFPLYHLSYSLVPPFAPASVPQLRTQPSPELPSVLQQPRIVFPFR